MRGRAILRTALPVVLVFAAVWIAVIAYWRASNREPNGGDVVVYLIALPLGLLVAFWLLKAGVRRLRRGDGASGATAAKGVGAEDVAVEDPERRFRLLLVGSALRLPPGESATDVAGKLAAAQRPDLHPDLRDAHGLPVLAACVADLDTGQTQAALEAHGAGDTVRPDPEQLRALTLAGAALEELLDAAHLLREAPVEVRSGAEDAAIPELQAHLLQPTDRERRAAQADAGAVTQLRAHLLLPARWDEGLRVAAGAWMQGIADAADWPQPRMMLRVVAIDDGASALQALDALCLALNRQPDASLHLLLACDSYVGERSVAAWDADGTLLTGRRPDGKVPGEGAVALLLSATSPDTPDAAPAARLHRVAHGRRTSPADARGRVDSDLLAALCEQALAAAGLDPDAVAWVVSDADQRPRQATELAGALHAAVPKLDPAAQCLNAGVGCGQAGAVTALAAVALAAAKAIEEDTAALAISTGDAYTRAALAATPPPPAEPVAAPPT